MSVLWSPYIVGLGLAAFVLAVVASLLFQHRERPGGYELFAFMLLILAWALIYAVSLLVYEPTLRLWLHRVMYLAILTVPVAWLSFSLVYTGHSNHKNRRLLGSFLIIGVIFAALVLTNPDHGWVWTHTEVAVVSSIAVVQDVPGVLYYPMLVYIYSVVLFGAFLILRESIGSMGLYHDQTAVLLLGTGTPVVVSLLSIGGITPVEGLSMTPYAFTVSGLAFGYAALRIDIFDLLPATRNLGRDLAIDHLAEGIFIVDRSGRIVDANDAGAQFFNTYPHALIGTNIRQLLAVDDELALTHLPTEVQLEGQLIGLTVSPIHDTIEVPIGHTVVLRDTTEQRLRKTQLEVLNRVLRHNLRNKLAIIQGHINLLADQYAIEDDGSKVDIDNAIEELTELSDRSREFERMKDLERLDAVTVNLDALVKQCVSELTSMYPDAHFEQSIPAELSIDTHKEVLDIVLENLLHNAIVHNDRPEPMVLIEGAMTENGLRIVVTDNGPGIPVEELEVLTSGRETAINHGSGLGLWVTKWAIQYLQGEIHFELLDSRGTRVTIELPTLSPSDSTNRAHRTNTATMQDLPEVVKRKHQHNNSPHRIR